MERRYDDKRKLLREGESQRKDGTYMFRWSEKGRGKSRKARNCIYAKTLSELREKEDTLNLERLYNVARTTETLNDRIRVYLNTKITLAESTMSNYEYYFNHAIKESALGNMHINEIRKSDIIGFYANMYREKGYSAGSIKILQKIIHPALQLACDDRIILSNPAKGCTRDYEEAPEKKYALTEEQEEEFLERVCLNPENQ